MELLDVLFTILGGIVASSTGAAVQLWIHRRAGLRRRKDSTIDQYSIVYTTAALMREYVGPHAWGLGYPDEWNQQLSKAYVALWRARAEAPTKELRRSAEEIENLFDEMRQAFYAWKLCVLSINTNPQRPIPAQVLQGLQDIQKMIDQLWEKLLESMKKHIDSIPS